MSSHHKQQPKKAQQPEKKLEQPTPTAKELIEMVKQTPVIETEKLPGVASAKAETKAAPVKAAPKVTLATIEAKAKIDEAAFVKGYSAGYDRGFRAGIKNSPDMEYIEKLAKEDGMRRLIIKVEDIIAFQNDTTRDKLDELNLLPSWWRYALVKIICEDWPLLPERKQMIEEKTGEE